MDTNAIVEITKPAKGANYIYQASAPIATFGSSIYVSDFDGVETNFAGSTITQNSLDNGETDLIFSFGTGNGAASITFTFDTSVLKGDKVHGASSPLSDTISLTSANVQGGRLAVYHSSDDPAYSFACLRESRMTGTTVTRLYQPLAAFSSKVATYSLSAALVPLPAAEEPTFPFGAVPEPTTWFMMIVGMGLTGGALRRHRRAVNTITAPTP